MPAVTIYTTSWCPYCRAAKDLLQQKGVAFEEIDVERTPGARSEMVGRAGRTSVPQIFVGEPSAPALRSPSSLPALSRA